jgi:hypothetical protein
MNWKDEADDGCEVHILETALAAKKMNIYSPATSCLS